MSPKENNKKVSAAVRILHQKRDASARATHLMVKNDSLITFESGILGQAAIKKFFIATFLERKIMSTKTSFKRIALVAASALAIAGFSAVPANAAVNAGLLSYLKASTTTTAVAAAAVALTNTATESSYTKNAAITGGVTSITTQVGSVIGFGLEAGNAGTYSASTAARVKVNGQLVSSLACTITATSCVLADYTAPLTAGTYAIELVISGAATSYAVADVESVSFTLVLTAASGFSAPLSSALKADGNGTAAADTTTDALAVDGTATASTANTGLITVKLFDAAGVAMANADAALTLNASIAGPGYLRYVTANTPTASQCTTTPTFSSVLGRSIATTTVEAIGTIYICADGNAGTSTITVSITNADAVTTQVGSTKTVTFFGAATKLSVHAANYTIGKSGGATTGATTASSTTTPAIVIKQVDKDGVVASTATPTVVSSDVTVVASGTCVADLADATYGYGATGYYDCSFTTASSAKSGDKATLTFRILNPADGVTYLTTTQAVTVGGSIATETLSFDAASYTAGAPMVITRTAVDSSGNPVFDGASVPAVSFTKAVGGTAPGASTNGANMGGYIGGKKVTSATAPTVFAPAVSGEFSAYMTSGNTAATTLTAVSSVEGDQSSSLALDAANAATDAANNAYDEAQNATQAASDALAAVSELATQVTSLIAMVKKLTAAVAKLNKKK